MRPGDEEAERWEDTRSRGRPIAHPRSTCLSGWHESDTSPHPVLGRCARCRQRLFHHHENASRQVERGRKNVTMSRSIFFPQPTKSRSLSFHLTHTVSAAGEVCLISKQLQWSQYECTCGSVKSITITALSGDSTAFAFASSNQAQMKAFNSASLVDWRDQHVPHASRINNRAVTVTWWHISLQSVVPNNNNCLWGVM